MADKRDMREMTMEDLFAAGVSPAEIHKLIGKMQEEKREAERIKEAQAAEEEAKKKREQKEREEKRLHRQEAREKAALATVNWMIAEGLVTAEEADRDFINEIYAMLGEIASEIRYQKALVELMKRIK